MSWQNPPIPWREFERRLSGRPAPAVPTEDGPAFGDGGDSPAWSRKRAAYQAAPVTRRASSTPYAELHAHSSFSFLDGASSPEELAEEAARLGLEALAITDHDGVYGVVRFAEAAEAYGLATMFGAELSLDVEIPATQAERMVGARAAVPDPAGRHLLVLARDPTGYASLCRGISAGQRRGGSKGRPVYSLDELSELSDGHWLVLTGCRKGPVRTALEAGGHGTFALEPARRALADLVGRFGREHVAVELTYSLDPLADERYDALATLAGEARLPVIAATGAHYHAPPRRPLATAMAAVRARSSLDELDGWLPAWSDAHLRDGDEMAARFARWPGVVETAAELGAELAFDLHLVAPSLPPFPVPPGHTEMTFLRKLSYDGARERYGSPADAPKAYDVIEHELEIIEQLGFPGYFLVVWDIVEFCKSRGILCQGRGSAANSAVCYALGITAVDAVGYELLFERFLAPERDEPPDIDLDIESDRREEVIQYVYEAYGRDNAAQVANVITYRPKSAVRDMAKALGYSPGQQDAWSKQIEQGYYWSAEADAIETVPKRVIELSAELQNAPRHLGIHSGGMVICDRPVVEVCPVEWGRMPNRTVLQWDKDDCAAIGLVKFDLLGLGMLSALHYCFELIAEWFGERYELHQLPKEDPLVYDMLCAADTVGVFQVESRAQMATLPRLRPRKFYDLVIEVRADPARADPGRLGAPLHPAAARQGGGHLPAPETRAGSGAHARRPAVPGAADADRRARRGFHPVRSRPVAPGDGLQTLGRQDRRAPAAAVRGHGRQRHHRAGGRQHLREDQGLRRVRLRREPFDQFRVPGLRVVVAQALSPGGVLRGAAERAADGLLLTAVAGTRRQAARRRGARAGREHLGCHGVARGVRDGHVQRNLQRPRAGSARRPDGLVLRAVDRRRPRRTHRRGT